MGLFSFIKNAGAKAFNFKKKETKEVPMPQTADVDVEALLNEQKAQMLEQLVTSMELSVSDLDITVDGDMVTIYGNADTLSDKEKLILVLGNVDGIATVDDYVNVLNMEATEDEAGQRRYDGEAQFHTVAKGDTLGKIAKSYYGNAMKYPVIFEANRPMLSDPNKIYPGQVLRIPPLDA